MTYKTKKLPAGNFSIKQTICRYIIDYDVMYSIITYEDTGQIHETCGSRDWVHLSTQFLIQFIKVYEIYNVLISVL